MSDKDIQEFAEKLNYGLVLAERRMLEEKALHGQDIVVCGDDNIIRRIPAQEALDNLNKLFPF
jgi:exonuclease III